MYKINKTLPDKVNYLQIISTIAKPPKCLYFIGKLPESRQPSIAVIGTRKLTRYGEEAGYQLTYELAKQGVVIISGLALGLDALAHQAALDAGGTTIAVLPCGLNRIYPASHRELGRRIIENGGVLISEYEAGSPIYPYNFIARNRLVSGLSDGLLVVEAAARSGTIHTANFALEQGKPVMAIPGNITQPMSEGCNNLIASGARLIRSSQDILQEIGFDQAHAQTRLVAHSREEEIVLALLKEGVRDGDTLQKQSHLGPALFSQTLSLLELSGSIWALGGNQWGLR